MIKLCRFTGHWWAEHTGWGMRVCRLCQRKEKAFYDSGHVNWEKIA